MSALTAPLPVSASLPDNWRQILRDNAKANKRAGRRVPLVPCERIVELLLEHNGSGYKVAKITGVAPNSINERRQTIEAVLNVRLPRGRPETWAEQPVRLRRDISITNGTILVGSDAHVWPEIETTAMKAFAGVNQLLKPDYVVFNGDGLDGVSNSRHPRIGWTQGPGLKEELEALSDWLEHVRKQNLNGQYYYNYGNHDLRFDTYLSGVAAQYEGIAGTSLSDHLPGWQLGMAFHVPGVVMIKHRHRGGIHAARNNTIAAGISTVTGHLHSPKVVPVTDYRGTRYGVDCGFLASLDHPAFSYAECDPKDWRPGFVVLTIVDGRLMPPELAEVVDEEAGTFYFRGRLWTT